MATVPQHFDKIGREILLDCCVAYPESNRLQIGKVIKLNNKMVKISRMSSKGHWRSEINKYPSDCVIIDSADVTMYILKLGA